MSKVLIENDAFSVGAFLVGEKKYTLAAPKNGKGLWYLTTQRHNQDAIDPTDILRDPERDFMVYNGIAYFVADYEYRTSDTLTFHRILLGVGPDQTGKLVIQNYFAPPAYTWYDTSFPWLIKSMGVLKVDDTYLKLP